MDSYTRPFYGSDTESRETKGRDILVSLVTQVDYLIDTPNLLQEDHLTSRVLDWVSFVDRVYLTLSFVFLRSTPCLIWSSVLSYATIYSRFT